MIQTKRFRFPLLSKQELALFFVTMLWGVTFLIVHIAVRYSGPLFFVGFRFVLAACVVGLIFLRSMKNFTIHEIFAGLSVGLAMFLGYVLQTAGLQSIVSSQSAFITALYVPMVPILQWIFLKRLPRLTTWIGVVFAFVGLMFVSGQGIEGISFSVGEILTILGALAIAGEIILIGFFAGKVDSRRVTVLQLFFGGMFSFFCMPVVGESIPEFSWVWLSSGMGLAMMSAVIQLTMNWAQKSISPTRATLIYAGEPVWAGIVGRLAGERLSMLALLGGGFILIGIIISELQPSQWRKKDKVISEN
ncbi:DMT family transporter [Bartonella ancashensis]|uniref:Permease of the drug/metabolite transporter (DMT) superfamily n=1 Tax=Bartonella ancashensis TaxID=1318743 RepID=A0A0M4M303_9HYPH|nr:DMT family transporter [Bartonella ancashensis]ALE03324.1 Permease of the drug/metabolite transporter (DMT) superfamily [Bartonella ancashensis]